jgi:haloalkane dehalogenase
MKQVTVLDSYMAYQEYGHGPTMVFLHGNPVTSHVWRKVLPGMSAHARCLAPDLIGMGNSGRPDLPYRLNDHIRYLDAWFEALSLEEVLLVGYDWGGVLAMTLASRRAAQVKGVAVFETFLRPLRSTDFPPQGAQLFQALRTPGLGERMVLAENQFLARSLENGIKSGLAAEDRLAYYAPYPTPESRRPLLQWTREIPIDGAPEDVVGIVERNGEWLRESHTPKLLMTFGMPNVMASTETLAWVRSHAAQMRIEALPSAGHHAPEDAPDAIVATLLDWARDAQLLP